jgi:hypothetical protein
MNGNSDDVRPKGHGLSDAAQQAVVKACHVS